jgi:hypothetical protein
MPIEVNWFNDSHSVIYMRVSDPWTWDDFFAASRQASTLARSVSHEVSYMVDFTHAKQFPRGLSLQRVRAILDFKQSNSGVLVSFGVNPFMRVMLNTVLTAVGRVRANTVIVNTLEDALQVVDDYRAAAQG